MQNSSLNSILHPKTVAVIGASDNPARIGGRPIQAMLKNGFKGRIFPVNPVYTTVQGLEAYGYIGDVRSEIDTAIIAVPAAAVVKTLEDCVRADVKSAIIFSSGFAETGSAGEASQAAIRRIARDSGMRVLGPNCLGAFHSPSGWFGTFANAPSMIRVPAGPLGIVSQSGAYGAHVFLVAQLRGVGAAYWLTTGNEVDVTVADAIEYYVESPDVRVILAYAEGVEDGPQLKRALSAASDAGKPVIFLKAGRSKVGAQAAASHTASLAGADAMYDALFRQYGVYRASTTEEMVDVAYALQFGRNALGRRVGIQTISGGVGIQLADSCEAFGLEIPQLPAEAQTELKQMVPFASAQNPVDFTAQVLNEPEVMNRAVSLAINAARCDSHVIYLSSVPGVESARESTLDIFRRIRSAFPDELIALSFIASEAVTTQYEALGYPVFQDPHHAVRAIAALAHFGQLNRKKQTPPLLDAGSSVYSLPAQPMSEVEAKRILAAAGIPVARDVLVHSAEEAVSAWQSFGGPVVLKIASPDIPHKTEIGGVLLHQNNSIDIASGYELLRARALSAAPHARIEGVVVAEMITGGVETVAGVVIDPIFGPAVMFGLGGIFIEVMKDVSFRFAPFDVDEANRMINEIRGRAVLEGTRGMPAGDIDALAQCLARLSVFASDHRGALRSIDINPLIVLPRGVVAVDALIVARTPD